MLQLYLCVLSHCRSQDHCALYVLVHMFMEPLLAVIFLLFLFFFLSCCFTETEEAPNFFFFHGLLSNTLPFLNFYLCISATIYAHVFNTGHAVHKSVLSFLLLVLRLCVLHVCTNVCVCVPVLVHMSLYGYCIFFFFILSLPFL